MKKFMEYMALGKPIVQFDLAEGRYSAQQASLYAKSNDAVDLAAKIVELLDAPARRAQMGEFGRKRVAEELEWRYEEPKLLAAYDALWQSAADPVPARRAKPIADDDTVGSMHPAVTGPRNLSAGALETTRGDTPI